MNAKLLMLMGTGSSVGKSALTAGLCRLYRNRGIKVAPFKAQNMALNSFITPEGDEIGRAQAVQAEACGLEPHVDMNPVLIKPNSDTGAQVIIHGKAIGNMSAAAYHDYKKTAWQAVSESLGRLRENYELIIIEGAGSPAEINLRDRDIVNMGLALKVGAPVLLIGDIDKGGVFASLVGTLELLAPAERDLIKAFVINKFRGDVKLLEPGLDTIAARTGTPFAGVVPWFGAEIYIPEEDGVALEGKPKVADNPGERLPPLNIGVIRLPHISNFTDFDPLLQADGVRLDYLSPTAALNGYHLIILPGSKNTLADLEQLRSCGFDRRLRGFAAAGGAVIGICGGYQMLGKRLFDPHGVESSSGEVAGLGLLPTETEMAPEKITVQCRAEITTATFATGVRVEGYEIHQGRTTLTAPTEPLLKVTGRTAGHSYHDGCISADGKIWGSYMHGIFDSDSFRNAYLDWLRRTMFGPGTKDAVPEPETSYRQRKEEGLNRLAGLLEKSLEMEMIDRIAGFHPSRG